jgi:hypothetical protein
MNVDELRRELDELAGPVADPMDDQVERFTARLRGSRRARRAVATLCAALLVALGVLVVASARPDGGSPRVATTLGHPPVPTAKLMLPSRILESGTGGRAVVVAENRTGHEVTFTGCGSVFQAVLSNARTNRSAAWPSLCLTRYAIPKGKSEYDVSISTQLCDPSGFCVIDAGLPEGRYQLSIAAIPGFDVEVPRPVSVRVVRTNCSTTGSATVSVPDFTGLSPLRAIAQARSAGFKVVGTGIPPDEPIGPGARVWGQQPSPHSDVRAGSCMAFMTRPE